MEQFDPQKYRDNLAKDLKEARKTNPEEAQKILEEARHTSEYWDSPREKERDWDYWDMINDRIDMDPDNYFIPDRWDTYITDSTSKEKAIQVTGMDSKLLDQLIFEIKMEDKWSEDVNNPNNNDIVKKIGNCSRLEEISEILGGKLNLPYGVRLEAVKKFEQIVISEIEKATTLNELKPLLPYMESRKPDQNGYKITHMFAEKMLNLYTDILEN